MPELLGFDLGGAGDIPPEIFEGDDVLGNIFNHVFFDEASPFFVPVSEHPEISDGEFILDLFVNAARTIKQSRNSSITAPPLS